MLTIPLVPDFVSKTRGMSGSDQLVPSLGATSGKRVLMIDLHWNMPEVDGSRAELNRFVGTFETWQEEILNYFEARQTSATVEGLNNKARVITKRAYGLKSADSLWTRLILDLNRAKDIVVHSIAGLRNAAHALF